MSQRIPRYLTCASLGVIVLVIVACGSTSLAPKSTPVSTLTPAPTLTPTPLPQASVSVAAQTKAGKDASALDITVTATCPAGKIMVGGGYHLQLANNQQLVYIRADYPSAASAWTVTESNPQSGGAVTLTAYALCLTTNFAVTTSLVTTTSSGTTGSAACPAGKTLVGGGFNQATLIGSNWITASYPSGGAWQVTRPTSNNYTYTVYAVCASQALTAKAIDTATATIANNTSGEADANCSPGQTLIGGGFSATLGALYIGEDDRASNTLAQWMAKALNLYQAPTVGGGGPAPTPPAPMQVVAYAICVTPA